MKMNYNWKYNDIKNYAIIGGAFLFALLVGMKPTKTDSAVAYNNIAKQYTIKPNLNMDSLKLAKFEKVLNINTQNTKQTIECEYDINDTVFRPQKNYLLENGVDGYSNYSVKSAGKKLTFLRNDTIICVRENGTLPWRNNNPGALQYGDFAKKYGAIGRGNRGFAVFPTREIGVRALKALLQSDSYKNLSISSAMEIFAPRHENNTDSYKKLITHLTGVKVSKKLRDLSHAEFERVVAAIIRLEGSVAGKETLFLDGKPIVAQTNSTHGVIDTLINKQYVKTM